MMPRLGSRAGRRGAGAVAVAAFVAVLLGIPAWAFFSVVSSGATGAAAAGTLGAPGVAVSNPSPTNFTFTLTAPSGIAPSGYRVELLSGTQQVGVCTTTVPATSCSINPGASGTYTYKAYSTLQSWVSTATTGSVENVAPVTTASASPAANGAGWNSTNVTVTLSATDNSGIVTGTYYTTDGSTPTTASTRYTAPFTVSSTSTVKFFSADGSGNTETTKSVDLRIDKVAPTGAVTSPSGGAIVGGTVTVSGSASDAGSGVASVQPQVQQGAGAFTSLGSAVTPSNGSWTTSWNTTQVTDGTYAVRALVTDVAGNTFTTPSVTVSVQNSSLTVAPSTTTPVAGTAFTLMLTTSSNITGTQPITVTGLASSPNGAAPTVPTTATFTNGVATISVTPTKAGSQTVVVSLGLDNRQGSTTVVVSPKPQGQLYFSTCSGTGVTNVSCPANSATSSFSAPRGNNVTFVVTRRATDDLGNSLTDASVTVTLTPSAGSLSSTTFTLTGGATSGTITYSPPGNSASTRTIDAAGTTTGVTTASARLTVNFQ